MKKLPNIVFIITATIIIIYNGCKDKVTTPPEEQKPPGYQEDIPWPSLANSPWPIYHGDPQNTGRSKFIGPKIGIIEWVLDSINIGSGIVIDTNSTIYFSRGGWSESGFYAIKTDKTLKWKYSFKNIPAYNYVSPLINNEGILYFHEASSKKFLALKNDGTLKWELNNINLFQTGINIGLDGTIYFIQSNGILTAVESNGSIKWTYQSSDFAFSEFTSLTFSPDGNTLYIPLANSNSTLAAFDIINKTIKWKFGKIYSSSFSPIVDASSNIYIISTLEETNSPQLYLFCLKPDGTIKWKFPFYCSTSNFPYLSDGTLDKFGNLYFGYDTLISVDINGNLRWKKYLNNNILITPLVCDIEGNIYLTINKDFFNTTNIHCYNISGELVWNIIPEHSIRGGYSPGISSNNKLIYPCWRKPFIFSIK